MKELCEARAKLEMSSNLAGEGSSASVLPPCETASEKELSLHISIPSMRTHLKQSTDEKMTGEPSLADVLPPFETARAQSDLFAVQCGQ